MAAVLVVVGGRALTGGSDTTRLERPTTPVMVATTIPTKRLRFGDVPHAELVVLIDERRVQRGSLDVRTAFTPYSRIGLRRSVRSGDDVTELRYRFSLACLTLGCVPRGESLSFTLAPARVTYTPAGGSEKRVLTARWPVFRVEGRVRPGEVTGGTLEPGLDPLAPVSYAVTPGKTSLLLGALAAVLAALGASVFVGRALGRRAAAAAAASAVPALSPLEYALALVRRALVFGQQAEQRRALERLARELRSVGDRLLAGDARRIAWSREGPPQDAVEVCQTVERNLAEQG